MSRDEYLGFEPSTKNYKARLVLSFIIIGLAATVMLTQEHLKIRKAHEKITKSVRMARRNCQRSLKPLFL